MRYLALVPFLLLEACVSTATVRPLRDYEIANGPNHERAAKSVVGSLRYEGFRSGRAAPGSKNRSSPSTSRRRPTSVSSWARKSASTGSRSNGRSSIRAYSPRSDSNADGRSPSSSRVLPPRTRD